MVKKGVKDKDFSIGKSSKGFFILGIVLLAVFLLMINLTKVSMTGNVISGNVITGNAGEEGTSPAGAVGNVLSGFSDWFRRTFIGEEPSEIESKMAELLGEEPTNELDVKIVRNLLWVVILLFIFSIFLAAQWPKNKFFAFLMALIASYIGSLAVSDEIIKTIVLSYGALFASIAIVLPMFVLVLFSSNLLVAKIDRSTGAIKQAELGQVLIVWFLWIFYDLYIVYFAVKAIVSYFQTGTGGDAFAITAIFGTLIIASFIVLNFRKARVWLARFGRDIQREVNDLAIEKVGYYKQLDAATTANMRTAAKAAGVD